MNIWTFRLKYLGDASRHVYTAMDDMYFHVGKCMQDLSFQ